MAKTVVTRLYESTLERLKELHDQGEIPRQLDKPAAQIDFILDLFLGQRASYALRNSDNTANTTVQQGK